MWRRTNIGRLSTVERSGLPLILQRHAPKLACHITISRIVGLLRAYPGKFGKASIGLHGRGPRPFKADYVNNRKRAGCAEGIRAIWPNGDFGTPGFDSSVEIYAATHNR